MDPKQKTDGNKSVEEQLEDLGYLKKDTPEQEKQEVDAGEG